MILRASHYRSNQLLDFYLDEEGISAIALPRPHTQPDLVVDVVAPAYFDLQINGGLRVNFTSDELTIDQVRLVVETCAAHGIASFCPTVITASSETIQASLATLRLAVKSDPWIAQAMPCFHLEGPFISPEDGPRGAHPREHVIPASYEQFKYWQEAAGGRIKLVTLAPEVDGALPLIEKLTSRGVVVAIGHFAGPPEVIRQAIECGAQLSTHLGNGCAAMIPRHDNILWEQLAAEIPASIIPDLHHLPEAILTCIVRCKGLQRLIITCDSSPLAGLPAGKYSAWGQEVEITPEGKIVLVEQGVLAGSWDFTSACVEKFQNHFGLSLADVHPLAADHPRKLLGLPVTSLEVGQPANLVFFQKNEQGELRHSGSLIRGQFIPRAASVEQAADGAH